jgi:hypothetical protein
VVSFPPHCKSDLLLGSDVLSDFHQRNHAVKPPTLDQLRTSGPAQRVCNEDGEEPEAKEAEDKTEDASTTDSTETAAQ